MGSYFGPIFGGCHQGPITSTGPASFNPECWAWESGPARLFFKPNQLPPQPLVTASVGKGCIAS